MTASSHSPDSVPEFVVTPPPPPTTPSRPTLSASPAEQRIDVLSGDRCCARCGFNLFGQTIIREPHYGLLMVRCPECGHPAAMQEYPTLTRWFGRVRLALAAAWLAAMFAGFAATGGIMYAFVDSTMALVLRPYNQLASRDWNTWSKANVPAASQASWYGNMNDLQTWWSGLPPAKYFADFGGWGALNWRGLLMWILILSVIGPIGMIWGAFFGRLRGLRLALPLLLPIAFAFLLVADDLLGEIQWYFGPDGLVRQQVGWLPAMLTLVFAGSCLVIGAMLGRPVLRAALGFVLPIRLLPAFAFLWLSDGKPLPRLANRIPPRS